MKINQFVLKFDGNGIVQVLYKVAFVVAYLRLSNNYVGAFR